MKHAAPRSGSQGARARIGVLVLAGTLMAGCESVHYARSQDGRIITRSMVRAVEPGMTRAQVEAILGPPIEAKVLPDGATLTYGEYKALADSNTMLWVHLDGAGRVREVYAKLYGTWAVDDESGVYGRGGQPTWEAKLFATAFPE